ncbi:MAG: hydrogenase large subunit [Candidatus Methanomethylophilaceae archaeon]|nr:hydrogenase large subunit [Candidatus Methanomethylophilaceae archaeon]
MIISNISCERDTVLQETLDHTDRGYRLMTMFADEGGGQWVNILLRRKDEVVRLSYMPGESAIPLSEDIPSAEPYERLMSEMSGIRFSDGGRDPIVFRRSGEGYPLQKEPYDYSATRSIPIHPNRTVGDDVFEIPVGPVHAGIIEPGHFRFSVAGETVIELNPWLGFTHRGVEKLLEKPVTIDDSRLVERISGDTCVANCIAYSEIMESGTDIPRRALLIRTVLAEMERLYNHIGSITGICTDTAFTVASSIGNGILEKVLRINLRLTGHRYLMNHVVPGGIRRDIHDSTLKELDDFLMGLKFEMDELLDLMDNTGLIDRMETTGILTQEKALMIGAVGPIARASGVSSDVRSECPYGMYGELGFIVQGRTAGDVMARTMVRFGEITESISLIHQCIQSMEPGETRVRPSTTDGFHCSVVEAPRGELVHSAIVKNGTLWRYNIRDPSFPNWFGMCHAVPGNVVPDFPLINKSFNLSYSGNDL